MPSRIFGFLLRESPASRAHFIGCAHLYIKNPELLNLLQTFDVNDMKPNYRLSLQFLSFESVPGLNPQVTEWMYSRVV